MITGATSGLGLAIFERLLQTSDYNFVIFGRNSKKLEQLKKRSLANQRDCITFTIDFGEPEHDRKIADSLKTLQKKIAINYLIFAAANLNNQPFRNLESSAIVNILNCNINSIVSLTYQMIPYLTRQPSRVLVISSVSGFYGVPNSSLYGGSKAFLLRFFESLNMELTTADIKISIFCPGAFTKTSRPISGEYNVLSKNHLVKATKMLFIVNIINFIHSPLDFFAGLKISKPMCIDYVASAALDYSLYGTSPIKIYDKRNLLATIFIAMMGPANRLSLFKRRFKNQKK